MSKQRTRIEDVAKQARVSTATVSRVLSNPDIVKPARRSAVLSAIQLLGYVPDQSARALASGRTYTVGCVVPSIDHAIFAKSTQSLQTSLLQNGYQLLIASHEYNPQTEQSAVLALQRRGVDALVLVGNDHLAATWKALKTWGKPSLITWSCDARLPSIGFDNHAIAHTLTQHLIALGHRRIGSISGFTLCNDRARSRVEGTRSAMSQAGLSLPAARMTEQPFSLEGGRLGLQKLMRLKIKPTAIVCGNDLLAAGALLEAQRMGIRVPQSLSICGVDNQELSRELNPTLTTVNLPTQDLGRISADWIVSALRGETLPRQTLLPFALLVRESTAPPPR
jgi:LacI family transcriptional regulator